MTNASLNWVMQEAVPEEPKPVAGCCGKKNSKTDPKTKEESGKGDVQSGSESLKSKGASSLVEMSNSTSVIKGALSL